MTEAYIPVEEQVFQLEDPIDRLWWFAQLERGVELLDGREPLIGSKEVLNKISSEKEPLTSREMFEMQYNVMMLGLVDDTGYDTEWPDPREDG